MSDKRNFAVLFYLALFFSQNKVKINFMSAN